MPDDFELIGVIPHYHELGAGFRASLVDGDTVTPIVDDAGADLAVTSLEPALHIPAGSFIDFECDYEHESAYLARLGLLQPSEVAALACGYGGCKDRD